MAIHSKTAGEKTIKLPEMLKCVDITTGETVTTDMLKFNMGQFETRIFEGLTEYRKE